MGCHFMCNRAILLIPVFCVSLSFISVIKSSCTSVFCQCNCVLFRCGFVLYLAEVSCSGYSFLGHVLFKIADVNSRTWRPVFVPKLTFLSLLRPCNNLYKQQRWLRIPNSLNLKHANTQFGRSSHTYNYARMRREIPLIITIFAHVFLDCFSVP